MGKLGKTAGLLIHDRTKRETKSFLFYLEKNCSDITNIVTTSFCKFV